MLPYLTRISTILSRILARLSRNEPIDDNEVYDALFEIQFLLSTEFEDIPPRMVGIAWTKDEEEVKEETVNKDSFATRLCELVQKSKQGESTKTEALSLTNSLINIINAQANDDSMRDFVDVKTFIDDGE